MPRKSPSSLVLRDSRIADTPRYTLTDACFAVFLKSLLGIVGRWRYVSRIVGIFNAGVTNNSTRDCGRCKMKSSITGFAVLLSLLFCWNGRAYGYVYGNTISRARNYRISRSRAHHPHHLDGGRCGCRRVRNAPAREGWSLVGRGPASNLRNARRQVAALEPMLAENLRRPVGRGAAVVTFQSARHSAPGLLS
jgi:hypothetical protein